MSKSKRDYLDEAREHDDRAEAAADDDTVASEWYAAQARAARALAAHTPEEDE